MVAESAGSVLFSLTPGGGADSYVGPIVSAEVSGGRHRVLTMSIPAQPTWRTPARALASV
jgi:hypothetical protein